MTDHKQILEQLAQLNGQPEELAKASGMSLLDYAQVLCESSNWKKLKNVIRMKNMHRELMLAQCRMTAIGKLMEIITGDAPPEVQRKACVDLLKATTGVMDKPRGSGGPRKPVKCDPFIYDKPTPEEEEAILNALQKIGEESLGRSQTQECKNTEAQKCTLQSDCRERKLAASIDHDPSRIHPHPGPPPQSGGGNSNETLTLKGGGNSNETLLPIGGGNLARHPP